MNYVHEHELRSACVNKLTEPESFYVEVVVAQILTHGF